ncbi:FAD binding domain-containing protein [Thermosediminibacter litoriperuensis]|uniref:FAD binding domain-containing protein n=1 Tax=Thermosediminibacter litoriperuensis TaxID=291989 RepID=UPI0014797F00|nr:FAD binding domain-containing protein [Thermosediminibacter litoriperuensis]
MKTEGDLLELLKNNKKLTYIAGGTDFIIKLREGKVSPELLVDISCLEDFRGISVQDGFIKIGAVTTFSEIQNSSIIKKYARCLAQAAAKIGSVQIRNRATIGGNIVNASPAADSLPALGALSAVVEVFGVEGLRKVNIEDFIIDMRKTCLRENEIVKNIYIPCSPDSFSSFSKVGARKSVTISKLNLAVNLKYHKDVCLEINAAVGTLGKNFVLLKDCDGLINRKMDEDFAKVLGEKLSRLVQYTIPNRASMPYKSVAIRGLAEDVMEDIINELSGRGINL